MPRPLLIDPDDCPEEVWGDPTKGRYGFRQMLGAGNAGGDSFTAGVMDFAPGDRWAVHRHEEAEIYLGLRGEADVEVEGRLYRLRPEGLLYIPGRAFHGVPPVEGPVRIFYAFAAASLEGIAYTFRDGD